MAFEFSDDDGDIEVDAGGGDDFMSGGGGGYFNAGGDASDDYDFEFRPSAANKVKNSSTKQASLNDFLNDDEDDEGSSSLGKLDAGPSISNIKDASRKGAVTISSNSLLDKVGSMLDKYKNKGPAQKKSNASSNEIMRRAAARNEDDIDFDESEIMISDDEFDAMPKKVAAKPRTSDSESASSSNLNNNKNNSVPAMKSSNTTITGANKRSNE
jgi:hypothetical protein